MTIDNKKQKILLGYLNGFPSLQTQKLLSMKKTLLLLSFLCYFGSVQGQQASVQFLNFDDATITVFGEAVEILPQQTLVDGFSAADGDIFLSGTYLLTNNSGFTVQASVIMKVSPEGERRWAKSFPDWGIQEHASGQTVATPTSDGGIVVSFLDLYTSNFFLVKFDSEGIVDWSLKISENSHWPLFTPLNLVETSTGHIVLLGGNAYTGVASYRLDMATGAVINQGSLDVSQNFLVNDMEATSDGGYILAGGLERSGGGHNNQDLTIAKFDAEDEVEWLHVYRDELPTSGTAIYEMEDAYVVVGRGYFLFFSASLNKTDGMVNWARTYNFQSMNTTNTALNAINRKGDELFVSGTFTQNLNFVQHTFLGSLDLRSGDWNWQMGRRGEQGLHPQTVRYAFLTEDGVRTFHSESNIVVIDMLMDAEQPVGGCEWSYDMELPYTLVDGTLPRGGWPHTSASFPGVYIQENTSFNMENHLLAMNTYCEDQPFGKSEEEEEVDPFLLLTDITIAPNPTLGYIRIALPGFEDEAIQVNIYDMAGRLLDQLQDSGSAYLEYDISDYAVGTYIFQVQAGSETAIKKVVKAGL